VEKFNATPDEAGEYYINSNNGGRACCNAASDCGTSDQHCWSSGTVYGGSSLCYSSDIYVCDSSHDCDFVGGSGRALDNTGWACLSGSWYSNEGCDNESCICEKSICAGETGHFITGPERMGADTPICCMGDVKWVGEIKVGGRGSNDCGTLDGVSYNGHISSCLSSGGAVS